MQQSMQCTDVGAAPGCSALSRRPLHWPEQPSSDKGCNQQQQRSLCLQARAERVRLRTENARAARHAESMRRFWQTRPGVTWQDAALLGIFAGGMYGLLLAWTPAPPAPPVAAGATAEAGSPDPPATSASSSMTQGAPNTSANIL